MVRARDCSGALQTASHPACLDLRAGLKRPSVHKNGCITFAAAGVGLSASMPGLARISDVTLCSTLHRACYGQ